MIQHHGYTVPASINTECLTLARRNRHNRDTNICFEDARHLYFVKGSDQFESTTTVIHSLFSTFDGDAIARKMVNKQPVIDFCTNYPKYAHLWSRDISAGELVQKLKDEWAKRGKEASELGTQLHRNVELFLNGVDVVDLSKEFDFFLKWMKEFASPRKWEPFRTEMLIYDEKARICGSIDALFQDDSGKLHMVDFKRSKEIKFEAFGNKKGTSDMTSHMPDTNWSHYCLQQCIYAAILRRNYNWQVTSLHLLVMHAGSNDTWLMYDVPITSEADNILDDRICRFNNC